MTASSASFYCYQPHFEHSNTHALNHIHQTTVRKCDVYFHTFSEAFGLLYLLMRARNAAMSKVTAFYLWIIRFSLCSLFYSDGRFIALWLNGTYCVNTFSVFLCVRSWESDENGRKSGSLYDVSHGLNCSTAFFLFFMTFKRFFLNDRPISNGY